MRRFARPKLLCSALVLALLPDAAMAQPARSNPVTQPSKLDPAWQARTRALFEQAIEIPTAAKRNEMPRMAKLIADQLRAAGIPDGDIRIMPHEGVPGDQTLTLIARWRAERPTK